MRLALARSLLTTRQMKINEIASLPQPHFNGSWKPYLSKNLRLEIVTEARDVIIVKEGVQQTV